MNIAIYGRTFNPEYFPNMQLMLESLEAADCKLQVYQDFYNYLRPAFHFRNKPDVFTGYHDIRQDTRFLLSVGGDGTLLDTITIVRDSGIPVAGVNLGRLGFLSSTSRHEIIQAVEELLAGRYELSPRSLVSLESTNGMFEEVNYALNEASIYKNVANTMIALHTWIDGMFLNTYWADGLIIATPTGSTAYSLSCGGPIISPGCANFVVTPIASHNLTVRPIVIPDSSEIRIKAEANGNEFSLSLDSRMMVINDEVDLSFRKASFTINLIRLSKQHFFRTIRDKLAWGLDVRN